MTFGEFSTAKKTRSIMLLLSYLALCIHAVVIAGYSMGLGESKIPGISFLPFLIVSIVCIGVFVLISWMDRNYSVAIFKIILGIALVNFQMFDLAIVVAIFLSYYLVIFFTIYDFKVN